MDLDTLLSANLEKSIVIYMLMVLLKVQVTKKLFFLQKVIFKENRIINIHFGSIHLVTADLTLMLVKEICIQI